MIHVVLRGYSEGRQHYGEGRQHYGGSWLQQRVMTNALQKVLALAPACPPCWHICTPGITAADLIIAHGYARH